MDVRVIRDIKKDKKVEGNKDNKGNNEGIVKHKKAQTKATASEKVKIQTYEQLPEWAKVLKKTQKEVKDEISKELIS